MRKPVQKIETGVRRSECVNAQSDPRTCSHFRVFRFSLDATQLSSGNVMNTHLEHNSYSICSNTGSTDLEVGGWVGVWGRGNFLYIALYGCACRIAPLFSAARYMIGPLFSTKSI